MSPTPPSATSCAMGRRGAATPPSGSKRARKADSPLVAGAAAMEGKLPPWAEKVLQHYDSVVAKHTGVDDYLASLMCDDESLSKWVHSIDVVFQADGAVQHSKDFAPRDGIFKVWQFGFRPECGNSGLVTIVDMRALITLVLAHGFRTDPSVPGVEKIVACEMKSEWYANAEVPKCRAPAPGIAATSLSEVKGWKRILAAWFVVVSIIELKVVEEVKPMKDIFDSFTAIHTNIVAADLEKNIFTNREVPSISDIDCVVTVAWLTPG